MNQFFCIPALHERHRSAYLVSGSRTFQLNTLSTLFTEEDTGVWIGSDPILPNFKIIEPHQTRHILGQEVQHAVLDANETLDLASIAILTGLIRFGGKCVFLLPEHSKWLSQSNKAVSNILNHPYQPDQSLKGLNHHFWQTFVMNQSQAPIPSEANVQDQLPTHCQHRAIEAIINRANGRKKAPLVLTAKRGRGKSYALGLAIAKLQSSNHRNIIITSARKQQLDSVYQAITEQKLSKNIVSFMAPDALIASPLESDLLIIDEAACLSVPVIKALLERYPSVILATTLEGYEGSGRGFGIRLFQYLNVQFPDWVHCELMTPIRWQQNDPLETFTEKLMLSHETSRSENLADQTQSTRSFDLNFFELDRSNRTPFFKLLPEMFQLLQSAHYQTSPSDLVQLLESPSIRVFIAQDRQNQTILAIALCNQEGQLSFQLESNRRRQGHLIPQLLAKNTGNDQWLRLKGLRIQRIATQVEYQRRGIGTQLLNWIQTTTQTEVDYLSSSFGVTPDLMHFWIDFVPVHFGLKQDKASATHSLAMIKPFSSTAITLTENTHIDWFEQWIDLLPTHFQHLSPETIIAILKQTNLSPATVPCGYPEIRPFESVRKNLRTWLAWYLSSHNQPELSNAETLQLVEIVLKYQPWCHLKHKYPEHFKSTSEKTAKAALKETFQRLFQNT